MPRLQYFSLRRLSGRIFFAFMLLSLVALVSGIVSNVLLGQSDRNNEGVNRHLDEYNHAVLFDTATNDMKNTIPESIFNPKIEAKAIYQTYHTRATNELFQLQQLVEQDKDPISTALLQDLTNKFQLIESDYGQTPPDVASMSKLQQLYTQTVQHTNDLNKISAKIITAQRDLLSSSQNKDAASVTATRWINLALAVFSVLLSMLLAGLVTRRFARSINQLIVKLRRVSEGDLTEQIQVRGDDEIAELSIIFNRTISNLRQTIARLQFQADSVTATSEQISISSTNQASSLAEQAIAVSQVSATVEELSSTSHQIAESANRVANSATNALSSAEKGYETIMATDQTMSEIRTRVNQIADRILMLNAIAQRIRDITKLIDNIANETHLLALNAAIESAGAGEEGQRFGVVASSVRKLAQRARVATVEIQQLVNQIQQAASASVMATEEGIKTVAIGEQMLSESMQATQAIIEQTMQTNELANAISLATDQQRLASSQVADTIRELSRIIGDISVGSQQYRYSVTELTEVVNQLNILTAAFVIERPTGPTAVAESKRVVSDHVSAPKTREILKAVS